MQVIDDFSGKHQALSNFFMMPFSFYDDEYPSAEHAFQAMKTYSTREREIIRMAATPGEAKRAGRAVELREDWDTIKYPVMLRVLEAKFKDEFLAACLLETDNAVLIEGNTWHDNIWGNCTCGRNSCSVDGDNALGIMLMTTRLKLRRK